MHIINIMLKMCVKFGQKRTFMQYFVHLPHDE